jgi:hypothetical protein
MGLDEGLLLFGWPPNKIPALSATLVPDCTAMVVEVSHGRKYLENANISLHVFHYMVLPQS